jgi:MoaA/NifB/PqqE/SkfB family radical SAM enzyme
MFREQGARSLARTSVAYICRRHAVARQFAERMSSWCRALETKIRPPSSSPRSALPTGDLVTRLASVHSLPEFHEVLSEHALIGRDRRFMDLEIDVSNKCNIRCRMCYFSFDHAFHARPVYLRPNTFASIAQAILPHARAVMLSLGSEPLTSPHFVPILEHTARHEVPEVGFYTNGLLMNGRVIDAVLANRVTLVAVSVDGATKRTFESIRRGADFGLLLRNVRALVRRRAEAGRTLPRVRFGVVMMRQNIEELPDIVTLAWRLGVEELNFFHAVVYEGLDMQGQSLVGHKELSNYYLERARARALELGLTIVHNPNPFGLDEPSVAAAKSKAALRQTFPYCRFPFFHVSASAEGQVMPCPFSHGEPAYGVVGPETSFEQIWLGPAFNELRRRILTNDPPDMCRRCSFLASSHPDLAELFAARRN